MRIGDWEGESKRKREGGLYRHRRRNRGGRVGLSPTLLKVRGQSPPTFKVVILASAWYCMYMQC